MPHESLIHCANEENASKANVELGLLSKDGKNEVNKMDQKLYNVCEHKIVAENASQLFQEANLTIKPATFIKSLNPGLYVNILQILKKCIYIYI